ncbi:hypothetical protein ABIF68_002306 [Bradyrhizobium japonicum]
MSKPRDDRQKDLLLPALDQIIDLGHPLVRLAALIDWKFLDERFSSVCQTGLGQPGLPTRLVAGLFILKHMHNLSDEVLCARWIENPYYQYFCGELSFCHRLLKFLRTRLGRIIRDIRRKIDGDTVLEARSSRDGGAPVFAAELLHEPTAAPKAAGSAATLNERKLDRFGVCH